MRWLKKRLQRWLGIEVITNRLPEIDLQMMSFAKALYPNIPEPEGDLPGVLPQNPANGMGVPSIYDKEEGSFVPLDSDRGKEVERRLNEESVIKKGYEKHES